MHGQNSVGYQLLANTHYFCSLTGSRSSIMMQISLENLKNFTMYAPLSFIQIWLPLVSYPKDYLILCSPSTANELTKQQSPIRPCLTSSAVIPPLVKTSYGVGLLHEATKEFKSSPRLFSLAGNSSSQNKFLRPKLLINCLNFYT